MESFLIGNSWPECVSLEAQGERILLQAFAEAVLARDCKTPAEVWLGWSPSLRESSNPHTAAVEGSPVSRELNPASICLFPTHVSQAPSENEVGDWNYLAACGGVGPAYHVSFLTLPPLWTL